MPVDDTDSPRGIAFADLNGDGRNDFALANNSGNTVGVYLQREDGAFYLARKLQAGQTPVEICALDVNRDGRQDLLSTNHTLGDLTLFLGGGDGTFNNALAVKPHVSLVSYGLACGDLDGDGHAEAVVTSFNEAAAFILKFDPLTPDRPTESQLATGNTPVNVVLRDFDGDSRTDVLVANRDSDSVSIFRNAGGQFIAHQTLSTGSLPFGIEGFTIGTTYHLAVANAVANTVQLFRLGTAGQFGPAATLPSGGSSTRSVIAFDHDNDGDFDLIAINASTNEIAIFDYDAGGFQAVSLRPPTATGPRLLAKFDINKDGVIDYAIVYATGGVRLFMSRPD